ncbi:hypothetical protein CEF21_11060 [Bacillus sp. FJAT-42376]|uniref:hypothetical protein n=1 Tax=Bacillus sp. FJAT-42376 TaxID=2014076 RepID=UPI000F4DBCB6|nr:hypothetical protein [Bacillus sp. FJAT-42376]AZB42791.1 hypothetical protein CEF21_11060 [Bacillus sp. FJAT-42376]
MIIRGVLSGLAGGLALGLFLKWVQWAAGFKVYTLLLNIDFIYPKPLPEWLEFAIHLAVAVFIGIGYVLIADKQRVSGFSKQLALAFFLTLPALLLYFPLSLLAEKEVPPVYDLAAFGWWAAGHLVFVGVMAWIGRGEES